MSHSLDVYRRTALHGESYHSPRYSYENTYYFDTGPREVSCVAGIATAIFGAAGLFLFGLVVAHVNLGLLFITLAVLTQVVHWLLAFTFDARHLTAAQTYALNKFNGLPPELQAEMGGRARFVKSIENLVAADVEPLIGAMNSARKAHNEAVALENRLRSDNSDLIATLDNYRMGKEDYFNKLKELQQ